VREGGIFGAEIFVNGGEWKNDVLCSRSGYLLKLSYDSYQDLMEASGKSAAGLWRRITKRVCRDLVDNKKLTNYKSF